MNRLREILNNALRLDADELMREIYADKELQRFILDLNRNRQLFQQGINSEGDTLESIGGGYTPFTIAIKEENNQPTDRVTLRDTGDFYASFELVVKETFIEITADPDKDGESLFDRWGRDVLGLTDDSLNILAAIVQTRIIPLIRDRILA